MRFERARFRVAIQAFTLLAGVTLSSEARSETEISGHFRSARPGASTRYIIGTRVRKGEWEGSLEYSLEERNLMGYGGPILRLNRGSFFQPHLFMGLGYRYNVCLVPGLGLHLQFGRLAIRMDLYYYLNLGTLNEIRMQTYGLSWTF